MPWASDGSAEPLYYSAYGDAVALTMGIPAAWRAMNIIAGFIAQLQLKALNDDLEEVGPYQLLQNPWPTISYFNWVFQVVCAVVLRGNFYAAKADFDDSTGNPRQYIPIANDDVNVIYDQGRIYYDVVGLGRMLTIGEVFHVRGFMMPGMIQGVGVIEVHRNGLKATRELMDYGSGAYSSGGVPPVVMTVDKPELSEAEAEYLQSRWIARHNVHDRRPAVIPKIVDVKTVGLSMQDAEYLSSRQFSIAEIAFMFNLDPADLGAQIGGAGHNRIEYQNIESKMRDRLIFSLQMWMARIEQAFFMDLPSTVTARFDTAGLFRANSLDRMRMHEIAIRNQIYTPNEAREMEGMPELTDAQKQEFQDKTKVTGSLDNLPPGLREATEQRVNEAAALKGQPPAGQPPASNGMTNSNQTNGNIPPDNKAKKEAPL